VYLAYTTGFPAVRSISLLNVGARSIARKLKAPGAAHVTLVAAPKGRLWLAWTRRGTIFAARTSRDATRLGRVQEVPMRKGSPVVEQLQGDASAGPLDVVASLASRGGALRIWHRQLLPALTLEVSAQGAADTPRRYVFRVTDAGEPVPNASVKFGKQTLTTGVAGTVTLTTSDRSPTATATKLGYAAATSDVS
jgi:hypothetical protein